MSPNRWRRDCREVGGSVASSAFPEPGTGALAAVPGGSVLVFVEAGWSSSTQWADSCTSGYDAAAWSISMGHCLRHPATWSDSLR